MNNEECGESHIGEEGEREETSNENSTANVKGNVILYCDREKSIERCMNTAEKLQVPLVLSRELQEQRGMIPEMGMRDDDFNVDKEEEEDDFDEFDEDDDLLDEQDEKEEILGLTEGQQSTEEVEAQMEQAERAKEEERFILGYNKHGMLEMERMMKSINQQTYSVQCNFYRIHSENVPQGLKRKHSTSRGVMHKRHPLLRSLKQLLQIDDSKQLHDMPVNLLNITAQFGQDAYVLMCHFAQDPNVNISVLQEDPILFEMIMNGRELSMGELFARNVLPLINYLDPQDPVEYLTQESSEDFLHDIIYCDLVSSKKKSKEHSYQDRVNNALRSYHGPFSETRVGNILIEALNASRYGVIFKTRKDKEPLLPALLTRSFVDKGMRYDIYGNDWTEMIDTIDNKQGTNN